MLFSGSVWGALYKTAILSALYGIGFGFSAILFSIAYSLAFR